MPKTYLPKKKETHVPVLSRKTSSANEAEKLLKGTNTQRPVTKNRPKHINHPFRL